MSFLNNLMHTFHFFLLLYSIFVCPLFSTLSLFFSLLLFLTNLFFLSFFYVFSFFSFFLSGLRCLWNIEKIGKNLLNLNLSCNDLSDISPLSSLTQIRELNLSENNLWVSLYFFSRFFFLYLIILIVIFYSIIFIWSK